MPTSLPFRSVIISFLAASTLILGGCDATGPAAGGGDVKVGFGTSYSSSSSSSSSLGGPSSGAALASTAAPESLKITGSNGTLTIEDLRLVVSGVELEGESDSADFEAEPTFLDLPLDTTEVAPLATSEIPPATYSEFEFEVEDVEDDEEEDNSGNLQALRESIRNDFPNWPEGASMVVVGTFTPDGDTTRAFTTFFEAEIGVERELSPPLEVTANGASRTLTVKLDPTRWFSKSDGTVWNLAKADYGRTGTLVEFEAEFEEGVAEIEIDEDD